MLTILVSPSPPGPHHHRGSVGVAGAQPTESPPAPSSSNSALSFEEGRWVESMSADGRMTTAYLKMPGSRVLGLRGKTVVDYHISAVLSVFLNTTMSKEWIRWVEGWEVVGGCAGSACRSLVVTMGGSLPAASHSYLEHVEEYATPKRNKHVVYQFFDMPWPLGDREFLMERAVEADRRARTVVAKCESCRDWVRRMRRPNVVVRVCSIHAHRTSETPTDKSIDKHPSAGSKRQARKQRGKAGRGSVVRGETLNTQWCVGMSVGSRHGGGEWTAMVYHSRSLARSPLFIPLPPDTTWHEQGLP